MRLVTPARLAGGTSDLDDLLGMLARSTDGERDLIVHEGGDYSPLIGRTTSVYGSDRPPSALPTRRAIGASWDRASGRLTGASDDVLEISYRMTSSTPGPRFPPK